MSSPLDWHGGHFAAECEDSCLKAWRSRKLLTQADLAKLLGVHTITVSKWERGVVPVPPWLHLALWAIEHNAPR